MISVPYYAATFKDLSGLQAASEFGFTTAKHDIGYMMPRQGKSCRTYISSQISVAVFLHLLVLSGLVEIMVS